MEVKWARIFLAGKLFHHGLLFVRKIRAYTSAAPLRRFLQASGLTLKLTTRFEKPARNTHTLAYFPPPVTKKRNVLWLCHQVFAIEVVDALAFVGTVGVVGGRTVGDVARVWRSGTWRRRCWQRANHLTANSIWLQRKLLNDFLRKLQDRDEDEAPKKVTENLSCRDNRKKIYGYHPWSLAVVGYCKT